MARLADQEEIHGNTRGIRGGPVYDFGKAQAGSNS